MTTSSSSTFARGLQTNLMIQNFHRQPKHCRCDIGMGLEWSGNETHQEVSVVKVKELVHEVEDA